MIDCDQNCTRDLDGICDLACRERWADLIDQERERAKRERREHLNGLFARDESMPDLIPIDTDTVEKYLREAEDNAIVSMAANKWERFGYWAAQSVHLRKILGLSRTPSPFRDFADLARKKLAAVDGLP